MKSKLERQMLDKTKPRARLRAAIAVRDERKRRVDSAAATLACTDDLQSEAVHQAELLKVEEAIVAHRADAMRAWAAGSARSRIWKYRQA
jgi:hypothetical protein